jgi:transcriptional regulator with XRE-family HTH domain
MMQHARRIRQLREQAGKSVEEMAAAVGMAYMEYLDLELHDDELPNVPSLASVQQLAAVLNVTVPALLSEAGPEPSHCFTHAELVERLKAHLSATGQNREAFEDRLSWKLDDFFASEERMLAEYNIEFLKALCESVGVFMGGGTSKKPPNKPLERAGMKHRGGDDRRRAGRSAPGR